MKPLLLLPAALVILGTLSACPQPNPALLRTETLTPPETTIQAEAGQPFVVVLPSLGATPSYKWVLQPGYDTALLRFEGERAAAAEYPTGAPQGYAPNRVFEFRALASGRSQLVFTQEPIAAGIEPVQTRRSYPVEIMADLNPALSPTP